MDRRLPSKSRYFDIRAPSEQTEDSEEGQAQGNPQGVAPGSVQPSGPQPIGP